MILPALLLRSSSPAGIEFWCALGVCAGIVLFIWGFRLLLRRRLILDTPYSKIRSAPMGLVEVSGLAMGPYTMVAPITARPCYYYRTLVWELKREGKERQWVQVAAECMHVPFFVDDNTGRVLVDPRGAELDLHCDFEEEYSNSFFSTAQAAPSNVVGFLGRHGVATDNKIKVQECCIKPKNALFVLGTLAENPGIEVAPKPIEDREAVVHGMSLSSRMFSLNVSVNGINGDYFSGFSAPGNGTSTEVVHLSSEAGQTNVLQMTQQQKVAAALVKAGIANPAAWAAAGVALPGMTGPTVQVAEAPSPTAEGSPSASAAGQSSFETRPPVVLMKGVNNKAFLISWRSQRKIAQSLGWKCALMIWGGPALALLSLYFLLNLLHLL